MLPLMRTNVQFEEKSIKEFGGINICEGKKNGELLFSENISSEKYPSLSSRRARIRMEDCGRTINGIGGFDGYFYTSYTEDKSKIFLTFGGTDYEFTSFSGSNDFSQKRSFASLSDTILIIPDNVIFSTVSKKFTKASYTYFQDVNSAIAKFKSETNGMTNLDNETIGNIAIVSTTKIRARTMTYTSSGSKTFYYCSFPSTLKKGDVIVLKMSAYTASYDDYNSYYELVKSLSSGVQVKIKEITTVSHATPSGNLSESTELVFEAPISLGTFSQLNVRNFTIERTMPKLESICSFGNRIWGTGGRKVYASKLADAGEWNDFTVDSYGTLPYASFATAAQTDGDFTAITPYGNYIYAFKENAIHKIYGDSPDEYTLHTENCRGVGRGMSDCVSVSASSIIYASSDGIYQYKGDYPQKISEKIPIIENALSAAASEEFYYILTGDENSKFLYVYDITRHIWHRESAPSDSCILYAYANKVYMASGSRLLCLNSKAGEGERERSISWNFKLRIDDKFIEKKGFGKLSLKYSLSKNASFTVRAIYDDGMKGAVCGARYDEADNSGTTLYLPIKRCNWFELEFSGMGEFVLKTMNLKFYRGSEI